MKVGILNAVLCLTACSGAIACVPSDPAAPKDAPRSPAVAPSPAISKRIADAQRFLASVKATKATILEDGRIRGFDADFVAAPGVLLPPKCLSLNKIEFNAAGQVTSWEWAGMSPDDSAACQVYFNINLQAWGCNNISCKLPKECEIIVTVDENGKQTATCPCHVVAPQ